MVELCRHMVVVLRVRLRDMLGANHPLFLTKIFSVKLNKEAPKLCALKKKIYTAIHNCEETGLLATGVPPTITMYVQLMKEMKSEGQKIDKLEQSIDKLLSKLESMPKEVASNLQSSGLT